jgi:prevent-host-death family protein
MTILISRTDLARNTRKVIEKARKGEPIMVESYGEEQVAILDAIDYRLLRAAARHEVTPTATINDESAMPAGLTEEALAEWVNAAGGDVQARWDRVIGTYLDGDISLGRAAVLLNLSRFELQDRFNYLGIPIHLGPRTVEEARLEYEVLREGLRS